MKLMIKNETLLVIPETAEEDGFFRNLNLNTHPRRLTITTDGGSFILRRDLPVQIGCAKDLFTPEIHDFMQGMPEETRDALRDLGLMP